jgi:MFS family permease
MSENELDKKLVENKTEEPIREEENEQQKKLDEKFEKKFIENQEHSAFGKQNQMHLSIAEPEYKGDQKGNMDLLHPDHAFDRLSPFFKAALYVNFCLSCMCWIALGTIINTTWIPLQMNKGLSESQISFMMSGQGLGSLTSFFLLNFLLSRFSRRNIWIILNSFLVCSFFLFVIVTKFADEPTLLNCGVYFCLLFCIYFVMTPIRSIMLGTISKFYPESIILIQLFILCFTIGGLIGPFSAALLLDTLHLDNLLFCYVFLLALTSICGAILLPKSLKCPKKTKSSRHGQ